MAGDRPTTPMVRWITVNRTRSFRLINKVSIEATVGNATAAFWRHSQRVAIARMCLLDLLPAFRLTAREPDEHLTFFVYGPELLSS